MPPSLKPFAPDTIAKATNETLSSLRSGSYTAGHLSFRGEASKHVSHQLFDVPSPITRNHEAIGRELRDLRAVGLTGIMVEFEVDASEDAAPCLLLCEVREAC